MSFIVDTNILITFFWKENVFEKIIKKYKLVCYSPEYALEEINKYKDLIIQKTNISNKEFEAKRLELAININFVNLKEYEDCLKKALEISPDPNDIDFFALALKLNYPIWSNDKDLKNQNKVLVLTTKNILDNLILK
jgi:predicted nucleic acid-binding protein